MSSSTYLLLSIAMSFVGAGAMWVVAPLGNRTVRATAFVSSLIITVFVILTISDPSAMNGGMFAESDYEWFDGASGGPDIRFSVGLDGLSVWLYVLSAVLLVVSVLVSWSSVRERVPLYYGLLLTLAGGCLGVFAARDILVFYVFFEFTLIPLFLLIGIWGSEERRRAAVKFFLFTLAGSVLTFLGLLSLVYVHFHRTGDLTFSIDALHDSYATQAIGSVRLQCVIFAALFAGFAIKVPLFPLHTWLPLAHVQAPTAGSVFLAGILLKIGTYGFLRFSIPMLPDASAFFLPILLWLAAIGIIYGALTALAQKDMKKLIAYSSVSHLGYCMLGLFAMNGPAVQGGTLQMLNHGISTGGLFAVIGMLYERYHTREIDRLGGLARRLPVLAFFMLVFSFSSIGLPGLNGFAGEVLILLGMFQRAIAESSVRWSAQFLIVSLMALSGVVLGAWYMLWLVQRVLFGPLREPERHSDGEAIEDLSIREICALLPLAVLSLWIGLQPGFFLRPIGPAAEIATRQARNAIDESYGPTASVQSVEESPMASLGGAGRAVRLGQ